MEKQNPLPEYLAPTTEVLECQVESPVLIGSPTGEGFEDPISYPGVFDLPF